MLLAIFVILIVVPIVELFVIIQMAHLIGVLPTILFLVLVSVAGAWLVKREGIGVVGRVRDQLQRGDIPTDSLVDGLLIVVAGAMLLFPGFVTDTFGLLLLLPPVRILVRKLTIARFLARIAMPGAGRVYDVQTVQFVQSTYDPNPDRAAGGDASRGELGRG